jgi:hypothetical protein
MRVDLDDRRVIVSWKHETKEHIVKKRGKNVVKNIHMTTCIIKPASVKSEEVAPMSEATVTCHPKDHFSKNAGRIISLTAALKQLWPFSTVKVHLQQNREIRKRFWNAYREMRNGVIAGKAELGTIPAGAKQSLVM